MARDISHMPGDIQRSINGLARTSQRAAISGVRSAAGVGLKEHERIIRSDSGGDMRLSGVGRVKGRPGNRSVGATVNLTNTKGRNPSASIRATGPLQIIANDTRGHVIRSSYKSGRRRRGFIGPTAPGQFAGGRRAVLNIPGIGYRAHARHPGTKGKDTWNRGKKASIPRVARHLGRTLDAEMTRGFKQQGA